MLFFCLTCCLSFLEILFIKDGEVFHQIYRGESTNERFYQKIIETLTLLSRGGKD